MKKQQRLRLRAFRYLYLVFVIGVSCLNSISLQAGLFTFIESVEQLKINSVKQVILDKNIVIFEGNVEVWFDHKVHLWADRVCLNKEKQTLIADVTTSGAVVLECNDFLTLADRFVLDLDKKTGYADNMRIHVHEGYVLAEKAEKLGEHEWKMTNMTFTACDSDEPHWTLKASRATLHGGYFIRVSGVMFKIGRLPIFFLPKMAFPIQGSSRSGFLIPKFSFDYGNGFGVKQEYYHNFGKRCDATVGVDWRGKKGMVFSGDFRWARSPESYSLFNGHYAIAKNSFTQKGDSIFKGTSQRYWIAGKDFQSFDNILGGKLSSLARVDFGTDKRIGYQFSNSISDIDDTFYNSWIVRNLWSRDLVELRVDTTKTSRKRFSGLNQSDHEKLQKKALENHVIVAQFPHFEWNTSHHFFGGMFNYSHNIFLDQIYFRERESEMLFFQSKIIQEDRLIPLQSADVIRLNYRGSLGESFELAGNAFSFEITPNIQVRSETTEELFLRSNVFEHRMFARGASRIFMEYGAEWAFPEVVMSSQDGRYLHFFQPVFSWGYVPEFKQDSWYHMDRWDRTFARHEIALGIRNNWLINDLSLDLYFRQGYDFNKRSVIHPLRRGVGNQHLLPFQVNFCLNSPFLHIGLDQEYDITTTRLLNSSFTTSFSAGRIKVDLGYLYQHSSMQQERGLLSNTPHFLLVSLSVPFSKRALIRYSGQFYSELGPRFLGFSGIKPLLHSMVFEYKGHCWGFYLGYEEKKYREFGNNKRERAIVFSLSFDSLGSFAKKFRRPEVIKD